MTPPFFLVLCIESVTSSTLFASFPSILSKTSHYKIVKHNFNIFCGYSLKFPPFKKQIGLSFFPSKVLILWGGLQKFPSRGHEFSTITKFPTSSLNKGIMGGILPVAKGATVGWGYQIFSEPHDSSLGSAACFTCIQYLCSMPTTPYLIILSYFIFLSYEGQTVEVLCSLGQRYPSREYWKGTWDMPKWSVIPVVQAQGKWMWDRQQ